MASRRNVDEDSDTSENANDKDPEVGEPVTTEIENGAKPDAATETGSKTEVSSQPDEHAAIENSAPPKPVGGSVAKRSPKQKATLEDDDTDDAQEEKELNAKIVGGKNRLMDEDKDEEDSRKKKIFGLFLVIALFIVFLALIIYFFKPNEDGAARAQIDPDETSAPTFSPTYFPTVATGTPSTDGTLSPTSFPTDAPTYSPIPNPSQFSRLPCANIRVQENVTWGTYGENNFKNYSFEGLSVCGDTFGGLDKERPQRSQWSVRQGRSDCPRLSYQDGFKLCDFVGARWCTINELTQLVAQGTGCNGDRQYVYSNTDCSVDGTAGVGKYMFNLGYEATKEPYYSCETDLSTLSVVRCCGDNFAS